VGTWLIGKEQLKTAAALKGEKLRAEEAETRFAQARQAVDTLFQISEEELTDRPNDQARKRILEVVLSHYEDFIEQRKGDEASQAELAQVQEKVKNILHELNVLQSAMDRLLFQRKVVQEELRLSDTQQAQLNQWLEEARKFRDTMFRAGNLDRDALIAFAERQEAELQSLLTAEQLARFQQLVIQSHGLSAFKDREVIRTLELTPEQQSKIRDVERDMFSQRFRPPGPDERRPPPDGPRDHERRGPNGDGPRGEPRGPRPDGFADGESRGPGHFGRPDGPPHHRPRDLMPMQVWIDKALAVLTADQVAKWRALTGEPLAGIDAPGFPGPPR
jgi:hypothetical protein